MVRKSQKFNYFFHRTFKSSHFKCMTSRAKGSNKYNNHCCVRSSSRHHSGSMKKIISELKLWMQMLLVKIGKEGVQSEKEKLVQKTAVENLIKQSTTVLDWGWAGRRRWRFTLSNQLHRQGPKLTLLFLLMVGDMRQFTRRYYFLSCMKMYFASFFFIQLLLYFFWWLKTKNIPHSCHYMERQRQIVTGLHIWLPVTCQQSWKTTKRWTKLSCVFTAGTFLGK